MELVFLLVLPATLWAQSWYFLDLYNNTKTLGIMAATAAVILGGLVIFSGGSFTSLVGGPPEVADVGAVMSTFIALWVVYLVMLAGVHLGGFDERTLGLYALFLSVVSILYTVYFFAGGEILGGAQVGYLMHWPLAIVSAMLAVFSLLVFFHLAPPYPRLRYVTGWFTLVISIVTTILFGLVLMGVAVD